MLKTIAAIGRRAGLSNAQFRRYYQDTHGELARREPLGVVRYVQNHVRDGVYGQRSDARVWTGTPRDGVTELSFPTPDAMRDTFSNSYVRDVLGPDGANFSDMPSAVSLVVRVEGDESASIAGAAKVMWFLKAGQGVDPAAFDDAWRDAAAVAANADVAGTVRNHRIRFPAGRDPADYFGGPDSLRYDGLHSVWWNAADTIEAMTGYAEDFAARMGRVLDGSRSFWVVVDEIEIFAVDQPRR